VRQLYKSHRTMGYEVARTTTEDGQQLVVLQTAPHKQEVSPAHMLQPVSETEIAFDIRTGLAALVERARFLGIDAETLTTLLQEELNYEGTERARGA
jgi:hypothetical protein